MALYTGWGLWEGGDLRIILWHELVCFTKIYIIMEPSPCSVKNSEFERYYWFNIFISNYHIIPIITEYPNYHTIHSIHWICLIYLLILCFSQRSLFKLQTIWRPVRPWWSKMGYRHPGELSWGTVPGWVELRNRYPFGWVWEPLPRWVELGDCHRVELSWRTDTHSVELGNRNSGELS